VGIVLDLVDPMSLVDGLLRGTAAGDPWGGRAQGRPRRGRLARCGAGGISWCKSLPRRVAARPDGAGGAVLEVADTGRGMDAATAARVFEAFFTTKGEGAGTGLGLAIVDDIVRRCGGSVAVESEPGRGTLVRVRFPGPAAASPG
jgi:hypothetical protein